MAQPTSALPNTPPNSAPRKDSPVGVGDAAQSTGAPQDDDGASTGSVTDDNPFSAQDAAIMADAFRKALRKPSFADRPIDEGMTPATV